jgi:hypothetical protein
MSIWAIAFGVMSAAEGVGDGHRGQWLPFWQQACAHERPYACPYLADMLWTFCDRGSGWACNESGIFQVQRELDYPRAANSIRRGCKLGFLAACLNARRMTGANRTLVSRPPTLEDYPVILRGSKGAITDRSPSALYARACSQGWPDACGRIVEAGGQ